MRRFSRECFRLRPKSIKEALDSWSNLESEWDDESYDLLGDISELPPVTFEELVSKSADFPFPFPVETTRCKMLLDTTLKNELEAYINTTYPLLHEHSLTLFAKFILFKRKHGTRPERDLYKEMTIPKLVDRLLKKRAVAFYDKDDKYILMDRTCGEGNWERIGKETEDGLDLTNCLSYDELKLSALLSVSSYTIFINDGNRQNRGIPQEEGVEKSGIIIGLTGARLEKPSVMEYEEIVVTETQNSEGNGYGCPSVPTLHSVLADFYKEPAITYNQANVKPDDDSRFIKIPGGYFDNIMYAKRISLSMDTFLIEANDRARKKGMNAYIHVIGIGFGNWEISSHQKRLFLDTFFWRLESLKMYLHNVTDVHFSYTSGHISVVGFYNGDLIPIEGHPKGGITVHFSNRESHVKLGGKHEGKLLVVSYAWDGNALPGNVYWIGQLTNTGDPAAACSTQIAELHNPHINSNVCGDNLHIATKDKVLPLRTYCKEIKMSL